MLIVTTETPDMTKVPGGWTPDTTDFEFGPANADAHVVSVPGVPGAYVLKHALSATDCDKLIELFMSSHIEAPVSVQGRNDVPDDRVGSVRATGWCVDLSTKLWSMMAQHIDKSKNVDEFTATDWWQGEHGGTGDWQTVGITPMLRFMRYEKGGQHYAHYDAGFIYKDDRYRTLMSFVLYLTTNTEGGATRFIEDGQGNIPVSERAHEDWIREVKPEEIRAANYPVKGDILFFDHRICHDVESYRGDGPRIIVRGDILFKSPNL
jgi:hypothetical protein